MGKEGGAIFPSLGSPGVSCKKYESIVETIKPPEKAKRITYKEEGKMKIAKYPNLYDKANAVRRYSKKFSNISESTVRGWLKKFLGELTDKVLSEEVVISKKRGRPLYLPEKLDEKLQNFLIAQRRAEGNINRHTV